MSSFGDRFKDSAVPLLKQYLGDTCTYYYLDGTTISIVAIFNEFVGAIDNLSRALFTIAFADNPAPRREERFLLNGEEWSVVDVRNDEAGTFELRCDRTLEQN